MSSPAILPGAMGFLGAGKTLGSQKQLLLAASVPLTPSSQRGALSWDMLGDELLLPTSPLCSTSVHTSQENATEPSADVRGSQFYALVITLHYHQHFLMNAHIKLP